MNGCNRTSAIYAMGVYVQLMCRVVICIVSFYPLPRFHCRSEETGSSIQIGKNRVDRNGIELCRVIPPIEVSCYRFYLPSMELAKALAPELG